MTRIIINPETINDITPDIINDFVNVPSGIPCLLMNLLEKDVDSDIGLKRLLVYREHPEYELVDRTERVNSKKLLKDNRFDEAVEYHILFALNFLNEYSMFKVFFKIME